MIYNLSSDFLWKINKEIRKKFDLKEFIPLWKGKQEII